MTKQKRTKLLGLCLSLLIIILIATAFIPTSNADTLKDTNVLYIDRLVVTKTISMTTSELKLYDLINNIDIVIPWCYTKEDLKQFKGCTWWYNHATDELWYFKNGIGEPLNDECLE